MARPTKYTPETIKRLTEALAQGLPRRWACAAANISDQTLYDWLDAEKAGDETFLGLLATVKEAEERSVAAHLLNIKRHSLKSWTASAWLLERIHPEQFARQRLEVTGKDGGPIQHAVQPISFIVVPPANADQSTEE